jgi:hypothetical protein
MARRASSGVNTQGLLIGAVILIIVLGGGYWFVNRETSVFSDPILNVSHAQENGKSLSGNIVQVEGTLIDRRIEDSGQIVTLEVNHNGQARFLPIILEDDFTAGNLNLKQEYAFRIQFNKDGVAVALEMKQL